MWVLEQRAALPPWPPANVYPPSVLPGVVDAAGRTWAVTLDGAITVDGVPVDALPLPPGHTLACATLTVTGVAYVVTRTADGAGAVWRGHSGARKQGDQTR